MKNEPGRLLHRSKLFSFAVIMGAFTLLLAGCSGTTSLTGSDNGKTITVHVGDEVDIALDSNPTTGWDWAIDKSNGSLLAFKQMNYQASSNAIGSGGTDTFKFVANSAGTVNLQLKYWRSFEGDRSITQRYAVTIHEILVQKHLSRKSTIMSSMYNEGSRKLQDQFDSRRIADRLEQRIVHDTFTDDDRAFIARSPMFFLATVDAEGRPDCSYKGGLPGFIRVLDSNTLAFPDYDGNGMFKSLGNILVNPHVGMLFIDFEHPDRMRLNGTATISDNDPLVSEYPGAQLIVRVHAEQIFPNCPRYIHKMQMVTYSKYAPRPDYTPPEPEWKQQEEFRDALPAPRNSSGESLGNGGS